jgi:molecular chaperone Hsp33
MDSADAEESVMLRLNAEGPIGGMMVEAMGDGGLRGFTNTKIMNDFDVLETISCDDSWGSSGSIQIQTTMPGRIINQASLNVNPPKIKFVLARYYNHSMQVPTACDICVRSDSGGIISARGMLAQRMEDSDMDAFITVLEKFDGGGVHEALAQSGGVEDFGELLGLPDAEERETRELMFKCRCTKERTLAVLKTFTKEELETIHATGEVQHITCHMCGNTYGAAPDDIQEIIDEKGDGGERQKS